jgi:hypothetical protein
VVDQKPSDSKRPPAFLYRRGARTPKAVTPRHGKDADGLTAWETYDRAKEGSGRVFRIVVAKLKLLEVVPTEPPEGHWSILPVDRARLEEWMDSRDAQPENQEDWHAFTRELFDAIEWTDVPANP